MCGLKSSEVVLLVCGFCCCSSAGKTFCRCSCLKFLGRFLRRCLSEGFNSLLQAGGSVWLGRVSSWLGEQESYTSPPGEVNRKREKREGTRLISAW